MTGGVCVDVRGVHPRASACTRVCACPCARRFLLFPPLRRRLCTPTANPHGPSRPLPGGHGEAKIGGVDGEREMHFLSLVFWPRFPAREAGGEQGASPCTFLPPPFPTPGAGTWSAGGQLGVADVGAWTPGGWGAAALPRRGRLGRGRAAQPVSPKGGIAVGTGWCHNTPCPEAQPKVCPQTGWVRKPPVSPGCGTRQGGTAASPQCARAPQHRSTGDGAHFGQNRSRDR